MIFSPNRGLLLIPSNASFLILNSSTVIESKSIDETIIEAGFINETSYWLQTLSRKIYFMLIGDDQEMEVGLECAHEVSVSFIDSVYWGVCLAKNRNYEIVMTYFEIDKEFEIQYTYLPFSPFFSSANFTT